MGSRAPFNVHVFLYRVRGTALEFAVFRRPDNDAWEGISGGGEYGEAVIEAARREGFEEAGIPLESVYSPLSALMTVPASVYAAVTEWPSDQYVIYAYPFAVNWPGPIVLSDEHAEVRWLPFESAFELLTYQDSQVALMELRQRLLADDMADAKSNPRIWTTLGPHDAMPAPQDP